MKYPSVSDYTATFCLKTGDTIQYINVLCEMVHKAPPILMHIYGWREILSVSCLYTACNIIRQLAEVSPSASKDANRYHYFILFCAAMQKEQKHLASMQG